MIACTPAYRTIGIVAPIVVLLGRLLQGFSAGVGVGGASVYLSEMATPGHRGFYCAWQSASQQVAVIFAALLGVALSAVVPPEGMAAVGLARSIFHRLHDCAAAVLAAQVAGRRQKRFSRKSIIRGISEILTSLATNWKIVGIGVLLSTMTTVSFYLITAYTPTYGIEVLHLTSRQSLMVTFCVGMSNFFWLPTGGAISDIVGRRPLLILITVAAIVTSYPAMLWLVSDPSTARLLIVELWLSMFFGVYNGAMIPHLAEIMPPEIRTSGFSLAFSLATAIFGGFTPGDLHLPDPRDRKPGHAGAVAVLCGVCGLVAALAGGQQRAVLTELESSVSSQ